MKILITLFVALFTLNIRVVVTILFSFYSHEVLLAKMFAVWSKTYLFLSNSAIFGEYISKRISFAWMKMCLVINWIQRAHSLYPVLWIMHYLQKDTSWSVTSEHMRKNVFLPESFIVFYRDMIFNYSQDQLIRTFKLLPKSRRLTELYIERQKRCGFTPLLAVEQVA